MKNFVLIVDDSKVIRSSAEFALTEAGFNVATAEHGFDGIKKIKEINGNNDVLSMVITDVNMPQMDGITFLRIVKKSFCKDIPVLVMTTETQDSLKTEGKEAGAVGWLTKPFAPEQLVSVVKQFVK